MQKSNANKLIEQLMEGDVLDYTFKNLDYVRAFCREEQLIIQKMEKRRYGHSGETSCYKIMDEAKQELMQVATAIMLDQMEQYDEFGLIRRERI